MNDKKATLNPKQKKFCLEYLSNGFNATLAYQTAYPDIKSGAAVNASKLLTNANISDYLAERTKSICDSLGLKGFRVISELIRRAFYDSKDFVENISSNGVKWKEFEKLDGTLIDGIREKRSARGDVTVEIDLPDRDKALEMLAKYFKLYQDGVVNNFSFNIVDEVV